MRGHGASRLGELRSVRFHQDGDMQVLRRRQDERSLQIYLSGGVIQEIGSAHHVRDTLSRIVDDHCQQVGEETVSAPQDRVPHGGRDVLGSRTLQPIDEAYRLRFDPQADGCCRARDFARRRGSTPDNAPRRRVPGGCRSTRTSSLGFEDSRRRRHSARSDRIGLSTSPSHSKPKASRVRKIPAAAPGTSRARSTSSMRTSQRPPCARASRKLAAAV